MKSNSFFFIKFDEIRYCRLTLTFWFQILSQIKKISKIIELIFLRKSTKQISKLVELTGAIFMLGSFINTSIAFTLFIK